MCYFCVHTVLGILIRNYSSDQDDGNYFQVTSNLEKEKGSQIYIVCGQICSETLKTPVHAFQLLVFLQQIQRAISAHEQEQTPTQPVSQ